MVVEPVDVLEVVVLPALLVDPVNAHVVGEQTVHADVAEASVATRLPQLRLPVRAQSFVGAAGADGVPEEGVQRAECGFRVQRGARRSMAGAAAFQSSNTLSFGPPTW
jgi:hypothetical protein